MGATRKALLAAGTGLRIVVHRYAACEHQPPHTDRNARITFVLRGWYREETAAGIAIAQPGDVTFKSRAVVHEDWFGGEGATLASVELAEPGDDTEGAVVKLAGDVWMTRRGGEVLRPMIALLDAALAGDDSGIHASAGDLFAAGAGVPARRSAPPRWLVRLREEVEHAGLAATPVAARARQAGVHPVHASRLFRSCFGVTITAHAQVHGVRRALAMMTERDEPLSRVAAEAGFYDQSHMNRVFRTVLGRSPGAVRGACAAAVARVAG